MSLTLKQQTFVDAYLANHGNATQAYITAGYRVKDANIAASGASHLLDTAKVSQAILKAKADKLATVRRETTISHAWALSAQLDLFEDARKAKDRTAAQKALDALVKLAGLLPDTRQPQVSPGTVNNYYGLLSERTDAELEALDAQLSVDKPALPDGDQP